MKRDSYVFTGLKREFKGMNYDFLTLDLKEVKNIHSWEVLIIDIKYFPK